MTNGAKTLIARGVRKRKRRPAEATRKTARESSLSAAVDSAIKPWGKERKATALRDLCNVPDRALGLPVVVPEPPVVAKIIREGQDQAPRSYGLFLNVGRECRGSRKESAGSAA